MVLFENKAYRLGEQLGGDRIPKYKVDFSIQIKFLSLKKLQDQDLKCEEIGR